MFRLSKKANESIQHVLSGQLFHGHIYILVISWGDLVTLPLYTRGQQMMAVPPGE